MTLNVNGLFPGELEPDTTVGGCIEIFENVWPNPAETIKMMENECKDADSGMNWSKATTLGAGANQDIRTNMFCPISEVASTANNSVAQNIHNQFYILLLSSTVGYSARHQIDESLWHEDYVFLRYSGGQQYKAHHDAGGTASSRLISCLCYLNNDYEGGEIEFVNYNIKIKPEPGMLILFPSSFPYKHIAHPVTEGTKYNLVTWIRGD